MAKVIVYGTTSCPWCHKTKDFLKEHGIEFEDVLVDQQVDRQKEMIEKSGQMGVPVLDIDGTIVIGFDEAKIRELLKITD